MLADRMRQAASTGGVTAYRYFQINISDNNGDAFTAIAELEWMVGATAYPTSNMTSNTAPSPLVASATAETAGDEAWHAFNGSAANPGWQMNLTSGYLRIDLGAGNEIIATSAKVTATVVADTARNVKDFTLEGSNDASSWDVLGSPGSQTAWGDNEIREFTF